MDAMNTTDLQLYIDAQGIAAQIVWLPGEVATVPAAATAVGVHPAQIAKSILFMIKNGAPVLVIAHGAVRVDHRRLASYLEFSRKHIRLANERQVLEVLGYAVGTVPPFGHRQPVRTILEAGLMAQTTVYAGGGSLNTLMRLEVSELQRAVPWAEIAELALHDRDNRPAGKP